MQQVSLRVTCSTKKDAFITRMDGWDKKMKIKDYALYNFATVTTEWHKRIIKMTVMSWWNFLSTQSHIKSAKYKIKICSSLFCIWILSHPYIWIRNRSKFEWKRIQTPVGISSNFLKIVTLNCSHQITIWLDLRYRSVLN